MIIALGSVAVSWGGEDMDFKRLLPPDVNGWRASGEDSVLTRDTIFDYLDGGGEIYLAYDFQSLLVREYAKSQESPLVAEIYRMSSSEDAFGVFSHDTDGEPADVGQDSLYGLGLLRFWKGHFFVRLLAERETAEARSALFALGKRIAGGMPSEGPKPKLLLCLPEEGLVRGSLHYFHKQVSLNNHYYLGDANILNLGDKTEAALVRYSRDGQKVALLLCHYPGEAEARAAFSQVIPIRFSAPPPAGEMAVVKTKDNVYDSAKRIGAFMILIFEARSRETCFSLTEFLEKKIEEVY
jgi:hypothetical protein